MKTCQPGIGVYIGHLSAWETEAGVSADLHCFKPASDGENRFLKPH